MKYKKQHRLCYCIFCLFEIFTIKLNFNFNKAEIFCDYLKPIATLATALEKQSCGYTGHFCSSIPVTNFVEVGSRFLMALVVAVRKAVAAMAMILCSRSQ